jgi:hypothetical protein
VRELRFDFAVLRADTDPFAGALLTRRLATVFFDAAFFVTVFFAPSLPPHR